MRVCTSARAWMQGLQGLGALSFPKQLDLPKIANSDAYVRYKDILADFFNVDLAFLFLL